MTMVGGRKRSATAEARWEAGYRAEVAVRQFRFVVDEPPGPALVAASAAARMLVVGTRGLGGFRGMVLGSVSDHCAHNARCPVVVVRTPVSNN